MALWLQDDAGNLDCNIDFHSDLISLAATAAPTFAKFTAQHFLRNLIQHELAENMVFILHENSKLFLDVLTDKLGWNY